MATVPRMTYRYNRQIELTLRQKANVNQYQLGAANTLDTAFAGTTAMFRVASGGTFRSPGIRKRRLGHTQYCNRGLSWVMYDPEDYWPSAPAVLPHDSDISFVRVAEVDFTGALRPEGPILVLPPAKFFSTPRPVLTLQGTAPNVAATPTGLPPTGSMHIIMPRFFDYCHITNKEPVGGNSIWISFGDGMPEIEVIGGMSRDIYDAADHELLIRSEAGGVLFDAAFALVNGEMA